MQEIVRVLPHYEYLYLGDSARTPYGNRSTEAITSFTEEAILYLFRAGARLIIVACFTASADALRQLQEKYLRNAHSDYRDRKILGVIRPVAEAAAERSHSGRIGVVGTRATVASGAFITELKKQKLELAVHQQACPLLVPLIEEGWHTKPEARSILRKYLRRLKSDHIDTLITGCTHYPLMIQDIKRTMGRNVRVLDSSTIVAESLAKYLKRHPEIEKQLNRGDSRRFLTTDNVERFKEFMEQFTNLRGAVEKITLRNL